MLLVALFLSNLTNLFVNHKNKKTLFSLFAVYKMEPSNLTIVREKRILITFTMEQGIILKHLLAFKLLSYGVTRSYILDVSEKKR